MEDRIIPISSPPGTPAARAPRPNLDYHVATAARGGQPTVMLPERFGRYEVLAEIGEGAMGRVYSAWDHKVSRLVAVKTVKSELLTSETADDYLKRFRREAVAAGALNHPQVVRIFDVGDDFLVMEFVEGRTLSAMIRAAGRIEPAETRRLLGPVADALDHAHRAGIVHRDIKPANVMVQPDGEPKLMDFGVAHVAASVMTVAGQVLGSPTYMSPEQIEGGAVSGRSDVYSLAVVAYEMLTGQPPFQGQSITQVIYRVMYENPPSPRRWNAALPARYDDVFATALAKDPARRFASASEFTAALDLRELEYVLEPVGAVPHPEPSMDDAPTVLERPLLVPTAAAGHARKRFRPARLLTGHAGGGPSDRGDRLGRAAARLAIDAPRPDAPRPPAPLSHASARRRGSAGNGRAGAVGTAPPAHGPHRALRCADSGAERRPARDTRAGGRGAARRARGRRHASGADARGPGPLPRGRAPAARGGDGHRGDDRRRDGHPHRAAGGRVRRTRARRGGARVGARLALRARDQAGREGQGPLDRSPDVPDRPLASPGRSDRTGRSAVQSGVPVACGAPRRSACPR